MYNSLTKEQQLIILGLIASIIVGLGVTAYRHFFTAKEDEIIIEEPKEGFQSMPKNEIVVHLAGAVKKEGVYKVKVADRLIDVLELAGGAAENADLSKVNLAEVVKDGKKIVIPERQTRHTGQTRQIRGTGQIGQKGQTGLININTANEKELDSLPGIGPAIASAIVEYREKNGPFSKIEQLLEVSRIGKSKLEKIKNKIML